MNLSYDPNGNIRTLKRNGADVNGQAAPMDDLRYTYLPNSNKLSFVSDAVPDNAFANDIDNYITPRFPQNYFYDPIGNLIRDRTEGGTEIDWNVYGKITQVTKATTNVESFYYDASGNRIRKGFSSKGKWSYYVRDAQGNVMATYKKDTTGADIKLESFYLYGSSRLGELSDTMNMRTDTTPTSVFTRIRGRRHYELSNHLGNVMVVVSDRKIIQTDSTYIADLVSATDYYAFGMVMPDRNINTGGYRFGFNGKENDNEIKGTGNQQDYGMRIYDPRLGRFLSIDPLTDKYPNLTPYQFASNRCIDGIDWDGLEYRKSPGIFHHYSSGWDINPSQLPEFYKNLGVTNKAQLEKQVTNTRQKLGNMNTDNYKSVTEGRDAGENLAEKGLNMLVQFTPEVKALNDVESQGEELRGANWVFNRAEQQGLIPSEFKTDNQFANDVVNFLYDGSLPQGEGPKGDIYKSIISDLGKEIYENRKKVIQGTYSGQYVDKKKEIIVPTPSGLDNYRNNDVYKPRIIDTGKKTPLTDRLKQFFNLKSGCTNCPVIKKTPGSV